MPENELAHEIYNTLGTEFVVNSGLQQKIFESYNNELSEMSGHEIRFLFQKLALIQEIAKDYYRSRD